MRRRATTPEIPRRGLGLLFIGLALALGGMLVGCVSWHDGPLPGEPTDATFVDIDDVRMRVFDSGGSGPPVVLVHGFASSLDVWASLVPTLAKHHRVIAMDLKGFGWSERPEGDYSPAAQAALVRGVMDHFDIERAAVVSHSWGCSVALQLALAAPERVSRLALLDAWVFDEQLPTFFLWARADGVGESMMWLWYDERPQDKIAQAFYDPTIIPQSLVDDVREQVERPGTEAAALAAIRGQKFDEVEHRYREIDVPAQLIWGREDRVTRLKYGERLLKTLPNARLEVLPQTGHFPMIEAPDVTRRVLVDFLEPWRETTDATTDESSHSASPAPTEAGSDDDETGSRATPQSDPIAPATDPVAPDETPSHGRGL